MAAIKAKKKVKKKLKKKTLVPMTPIKTRERIARLPLPILMSQEKMLGKYTNRAIIKHTRREFVFDFFLSIDEQNTLASRVITSPQHAKQIYKALGVNIKQYEGRFGEIILK